MPNVSNASVVLIVVLVALGLFLLGGCRIGCGKNSENYTRTPLSGDTTAHFVRTPVDYAPRYSDAIFGPAAWQKNPHWKANPRDERQPLGFGPIDFYADERKLADGTLYQEFDNNYVGGTGEPFIPNDQKTRSLLVEVGDIGPRRVLDNVPARGWPHDPHLLPAQTDGTAVCDTSNPDHDPLYGGKAYFFRDQVGDD
jgi:hypothetical protein